MAKLDVIGPAYANDSLDINAQRCVNLYLNMNEQTGDKNEDSVSPKQLLPTPGLKQMIDLGKATCRSMVVAQDRLFVVADRDFIELTYNSGTDSMTSTTHGQINTMTGSVSMSVNPTQILIVDDTQGGAIFTLATNSLDFITDVDFPNAKTSTYLDSYFVTNAGTDGTMSASGQNDGTSWNALDIATAESKADKLVAVKGFNDELWALGEESVEVWYNAGNPTGFPFSPRGDIVLDVGCAAADSVVSFKNTLMWLDEDGTIYQVAGYNPAIISTKAITAEINGYETISDARAYAYAEGGHFFYVLTFPTADKTWAYDLKTRTWHERAYLTSGGALTRHLSNCYAYYERRHFVGNYNNGKIYRMANDLYDDAGDEIQRLRTTQHGHIENRNITLYSVELLLEAGVGLATGQGSDPQISLEISKDGGHTWSNELWRSMGKIGEYDKRVRWNRLGTSRNFTLRFKVSDPVKVVLIDASADISVGI